MRPSPMRVRFGRTSRRRRSVIPAPPDAVDRDLPVHLPLKIELDGGGHFRYSMGILRVPQVLMLLALALAAPAGGCAHRSVKEGPEAFDQLAAERDASIRARPAAIAGVEVIGVDPIRPFDHRWWVFIPLWPFARSSQPVLDGQELAPEIERALWPRFENRPGQRRLLVRCTLEVSRIEVSIRIRHVPRASSIRHSARASALAGSASPMVRVSVETSEVSRPCGSIRSTP